MDEIKIVSPATVANVSCGFDALGLAIDTIGDVMHFKKIEKGELKIVHIEGAELPKNIKKNAASIVAMAMLNKSNANFGLAIEIDKKIKPGSGLGSSASSSAGAAYAVNELLGRPFSLLELTQFARIGEEVACGSPIADNVAAALYGGFILVRSYKPLEIVKLPVPNELYVTVIHPQIEIKTEHARSVLRPQIPISDSVKQSANLAGLISGLYTDDYELISRSLIDVIAEPYRKVLIPRFDEVKRSGMDSGALGVGISGSGPALFALCKGKEIAKKVSNSWQDVYEGSGIESIIYTSKVNTNGVQIVKE